MNYLADTYGDEIRVDLLRRPLADVLQTHDTTIGQLFDDLVAALAVEPPTAEYAARVACTGRYRGGQRPVFEARILNGDDRAATQTLFQQQYCRDASRGWTTRGSWSVIPRGINVSNFSNPLFTGPDCTPFQWRVRAATTTGRVAGGGRIPSTGQLPPALADGGAKTSLPVHGCLRLGRSPLPARRHPAPASNSLNSASPPSGSAGTPSSTASIRKPRRSQRGGELTRPLGGSSPVLRL